MGRIICQNAMTAINHKDRFNKLAKDLKASEEGIETTFDLIEKEEKRNLIKAIYKEIDTILDQYNRGKG